MYRPIRRCFSIDAGQRSCGLNEFRQILPGNKFRTAVGRTVRADSAITEDNHQGNDLTKYLSRRVTTGFTLPPKPGAKNLAILQHLDLLLNEWGIHHLHISMTPEADGFVKRDDPLLFAMFHPETTYPLDIGTHSSFVDERLAVIAIENWP